MSPRHAANPAARALPLPGLSWVRANPSGRKELNTSTVPSNEPPSTRITSQTVSGIDGNTCRRFFASLSAGITTEIRGSTDRPITSTRGSQISPASAGARYVGVATGRSSSPGPTSTSLIARSDSVTSAVPGPTPPADLAGDPREEHLPAREGEPIPLPGVAYNPSDFDPGSVPSPSFTWQGGTPSLGRLPRCDAGEGVPCTREPSLAAVARGECPPFLHIDHFSRVLIQPRQGSRTVIKRAYRQRTFRASQMAYAAPQRPMRPGYTFAWM